MFTKTWSFSPILLVLLVGVVPACGNDPGCPTCLDSGRKPIPNIAGVWSIEVNEYISGGLGFTKHLVAELSQHDSVIVGRIGGSVTSCLVGFGCFTTLPYAGEVTGHVTSDSLVTLQWLEDTTRVDVEGRVGLRGLSGINSTTSWEASRRAPFSVAEAKARFGDTVIVRGVVTVSRGTFTGGDFYPGNVVYVQDASGGIEVVGLFSRLPILLGDSVLIMGISKEDGYGEQAIIPVRVSFSGVDPWPPTAVSLGLGTVPLPRIVTVAEIAARRFEGGLVAVPGVRLVSKPSSASGSYSLTFADDNGARFTVFVHTTVTTTVSLVSWVVGATYDLTGIPGSFQGTPNLQLRGPDDRMRR